MHKEKHKQVCKVTIVEKEIRARVWSICEGNHSTKRGGGGCTLGVGELDSTTIKEDVHILNTKNGIKPKAPQCIMHMFGPYAHCLMELLAFSMQTSLRARGGDPHQGMAY